MVKTGHLESRTATNTWVHPDGSTEAAASSWVDTTNTHGTGCSLSSALATLLGQGDAPAEALGWVTDWLHEAILHGAQLEVGKGNGPVDHGHLTRRLTAAASVTPWVGVDEVPDGLDSPDDVGAAVHVPRAEVPAAGPWTEALWRAGAKVTRRIEHTDFVAALVDSSLSRSAFDFYLVQDAHYLNDYSRALAALSARVTERDEGAFWARSASTVLVEEAELHRTWLDGRPPAAVSPVTRSYTDFLMARALGDDYPGGWLQYCRATGSTPMSVRSCHRCAPTTPTRHGWRPIATRPSWRPPSRPSGRPSGHCAMPIPGSGPRRCEPIWWLAARVGVLRAGDPLTGLVVLAV